MLGIRLLLRSRWQAKPEGAGGSERGVWLGAATPEAPGSSQSFRRQRSEEW